MTPVKRNLTAKVDSLLQMFPVVVIVGARQCGKTTIAKLARPDWKYFDLENAATYDQISHDYNFFFQNHKEAIIIDEFQLLPDMFKELRGIIDMYPDMNNRYILTGSSSFELLNNISESLPGRVAIVELETLKMNETYEQSLPNLYNIFNNKINLQTTKTLHELKITLTRKQVEQSLLAGGYPKPVLSNNHGFFQQWMDNYFKTYINRDIRSLFPRLNIVNYRRLILMLSSLSGSMVNKAEIARSLETSEVTVKEYIDIAHGSFIWRNLFSYESSNMRSLVKMPKGYFRDTGLSNYLRRIDNIDDLYSYPYVGIAFESFVIEELLKGLEATMQTNWDYRYYRTRNGAEIDLLLTGSFGILPIEIKFGMNTKLKQLTTLNSFIKDNNLPLGIVINFSNTIEQISETIVQIPVSLI